MTRSGYLGIQKNILLMRNPGTGKPRLAITLTYSAG